MNGIIDVFRFTDVQRGIADRARGSGATFGAQERGVGVNREVAQANEEGTVPKRTASEKQYASMLIVQTLPRSALLKKYTDARYPRQEVITVVDEVKLRKRLARYGQIDKLVIITHGAPGHVIIGNSALPFERLARDWKNAPLPRVGTLQLDGCNIGDVIIPLAEFAALFSAKRVHASRYALYLGSFDVRNAQLAKIQAKLKGFIFDATASSPGFTTIWYEFHADGIFADSEMRAIERQLSDPDKPLGAPKLLRRQDVRYLDIDPSLVDPTRVVPE